LDSGITVLILVLLVGAILFTIQFRGPTSVRFKSAGESFTHNFGQGVYGTLAAIAILIAGFLYLVERQWSPRFSVDLKTRSVLLPIEGPRKFALVHTLVAVKNHGRTRQKVKNIQIFAVSLQGLTSLRTSRYGDLPGRDFYAHTNPSTYTIASGETELIAFEIPVSCNETLIRILVKVPQPPFREHLPKGKKPDVYERKVIVPLGAVCRDPAAVSETPYQGSDLDSAD
jgi:hypothetical protein